MKFNYLFVLILLLSLTSCSSYYYPNLLMTNLNENDLKDINELQIPPAQTIKKEINLLYLFILIKVNN